jgi:hypothetical protein
LTREEKRFREAERRLDELLRNDEAKIAAHGIAIADESGRELHYKNEYLEWRYRFEIKRARGFEMEKVWTVVSLDENNVSEVRVWIRAELFQVGQSSRWQSTTEHLLPIERVVQQGLEGVVLEAMREGQAAAAGAA